MRGNAELPEQRKQAGREQQVVDVASRLLVLLDGDVLCLDELRSVVLNRAGRRFAQERQRGLGWIAVILVPTELKDDPVRFRLFPLRDLRLFSVGAENGLLFFLG